MAKILGIDLGTTNSCCAIVEVGQPQVLVNREGSRTTPSIVGFTEEGDRLIGQIAKRQAITNPANTIFAVKRLIGRKGDDDEILHAKDVLPYKLVAAPNGDVKIQVRGRECSPEEISAYILREIKEFAEEALGEPIEKAVITVPAYFDDSQRQATKDAGRIAGLDVQRILNEPTAAALAYGAEKRDEDSIIAVYDLGGGTFDISILELTAGMFEVLATAGDTYLGGEDFDAAVMGWLLQEFLEETSIDLRDDRMALQRLKEASEKAKCELSTVEETEITLPFISADDSGPKHLNRTLTRKLLEQLVDPLIQRTFDPCENALEAAGLDPTDIDDIILVGGQTRMPRVIESVEEMFGREPNRDINPDEVVAIGAAIQGGILVGDVTDLVLLDVTPLSIGVETHGGLYTKLIKRNATIPTKNTQIFTTVADNQTRVQVHVLQGEREFSRDNKSLGKFDLVGIPAAPRNVPQIEVTFSIDSNGIVKVGARDMATGSEQSMEITPAGGLSVEEIESLVTEAEELRVEDEARREVRQTKNKLEGLLYTNEKVYKEFGDLLPEEQREKVRDILEFARQILTQDHKQKINDAIFEMQTVAKILTEVMLYKPSSGSGLPNI